MIRLGSEAEETAVRWFQHRGYRLLDRNFHSAYGEIDLIIQKQNRVSFVEVKSRKSVHFVSPQAAVTTAKQKRIIRTAQYYLLGHSFPKPTEFQFDVLCFIGKAPPEYIPNAFDADHH
jgi:putative endonuclease